MFDHAQSPRLGQPTPVENPGVQLVTLATLPEVAYRGQIVYLTDIDQFRVYDDQNLTWQNPTAAATGGTQTFVGSETPIADAIGDLWMNNATYQLSVWDGIQWRSAVDPRVTALQADLSVTAGQAQAALNAQTGFNTALATKTTTFYLPVKPAAPNYAPATGDLWINTVTNRLYRFSSPTAVTEIVDSQIVDAYNKAGIAKDIADAKISTWYVKPTGLGPLDDGDLWFDTANGNQLNRWNGSGWVLVQDTSIAAAATAATNAYNRAGAALDAATIARQVADGAISTYYLPSPPWANNTAQDDAKLGDLWFNTNTNQASRWNGTIWALITDNQINLALANAKTAQDTADGKITAWYRTTPPWPAGATGHTLDAGDLWYDTTPASKNKPYYWDDSTKTWIAVRDLTIQDAQDTANVKSRVTYATTPPWANAATGHALDQGDIWFDTTQVNGVALNKPYFWNDATKTWTPASDKAVADAQATANSKTSTFVGSAQPTGVTAGDLWINSGNFNELKRWDGSSQLAASWVTVRDATILTAQNTANSKTTTFYGSSQPVGVTQGDLWYNTGNNLEMKRWDGGGQAAANWITVRDATIKIAQDQADAKSKAYYATTPPWANQATSHALDQGDLWYDTTLVNGNPANKPYYWNDGTKTWTAVQDLGIPTAQSTADSKAKITYATAPPWANNATGHAIDQGDIWYDTTVVNGTPAFKPYYWNDPTKTWTPSPDATIAVAQTTANSKITTYYARVSVPPVAPAAGFVVGDLWVVQAEDKQPPSNLTRRWSGTAGWVDLAVGAGALADHAVGATQLDPMIQLSSTITTRAFDTNGVLTGSGLDITPGGMTTYDVNGNPRVVLPNNPLLPAVFRGDAEIDHLTVGTLTTLQQTVLAQNSVMELQSGVARPSFPPAPATTWATTNLTNDNQWGTRRYLAVNGSNIYTISATSTDFTIERWANGVLGMGRTWTNINGATGNWNGGDEVAHGLAHDGTNLWLLTQWVPNDGTQGYHLYQLDPATFQITKQWLQPISGSGPEVNQRNCALSWDAVNSRLIVAQSRTTTSDFVRIFTINGITGSATPTWTTLLTTNFAYGFNLSSLGYGLFDFGDTTNRYFFQNYGATNAQVCTTAGVRAPTYEWDNCWGYIGSVNAGTTWDAGTATFVTLNRAAQKVSYEAGTNWIGLSQGPESTWYAAYTWRGAPINFTATTTTGQTSITVSSTTGLNPGLTVTGAGIPANTSIVSVGAGAITLSAAATATASGVAVTTSQPETVPSGVSPFTMLKRARVVLTAAQLPPTGVTGARFYIAKGTTAPDPLTASLKSVGNSTGTTSPARTVTTPVFGPPYDNPIVSTFGSGVPAQLSSFSSTGSPVIKLSGDGSGRVGPLSWDNNGNTITQPATPTDTTKQNLPIFNTLTTAFSRTATTFASAGMSVSLQPGTYLFKVRGTYQSSVTTTGIAIRNGGTAISSALNAEVIIYGGANSTTAAWFTRVQTAMGQAISPTTGVQAANTANPFSIEGYVVITSSGSLSVDIAGQDATGTVRLNPGTMIYATQIA